MGLGKKEKGQGVVPWSNRGQEEKGLVHPLASGWQQLVSGLKWQEQAKDATTVKCRCSFQATVKAIAARAVICRGLFPVGEV